MKRLLIVTDGFLPRWEGIMRFLTEIIPKLAKKYNITLLAPDFGDKGDIFKDIKLIKMPVKTFSIGDLTPAKFSFGAVKKIVMENDIVFVQSIGSLGISSIRAAKKLKKPVIAFAHIVEWEVAKKNIGRFKFLVGMIAKALARYSYNKTDLIIVPYSELGELFHKNGINVQCKTVTLGADTKKFVPPADKAEAKKKMGFEPDAKVIGFVGRISREKDIGTLYRAFRMVEKKFSNVKLLIIGKGIKDEEKIFSDNRNVVNPGWVDNVVPYLQAMDIFVLPSMTETTSLATMEAMACGVPVLVTPVGYVKNYVKEKINGMFFPFRNSLVLSMKLGMLLKDDELRKKLGEHARKTIVEHYNWEKTAEQIEEYLSYY